MRKFYKLCIYLISIIMPCTAFAEMSFTVDGITYSYEYKNRTASVIKSVNDSYSGRITIPSQVTYNGYTYSVISIGDNAFNSRNITHVEIPESVVSIENSAFSSCRVLSSVKLSNGVKTIGSIAFGGCTSLTSIDIPNSVISIDYGAFSGTGLTSIELPNSITSIGEYVFYNCKDLTSIIVDKNNAVYDSRNNCNAIIHTATNTLISGCKNTKIPNGITSIGDRAFYFCVGLTSIEIPSSVKSIGESAFTGCNGLTSIEIPNSVMSIGSYAFSGCTGLASIIVDKNNQVYDSRNNCNAIIETSTNTLISGCKSSKIYSSVTGIGNFAFYDCRLTSIEIPNSVKSIGEKAFYECENLTSIKIPNSVTSIGKYALAACRGLRSVELPNSITSIEEGTFETCTNLTLIVIPSSVATIGSYAFRNCTSLKSVDVLGARMSIGNSAFARCSGIETVSIWGNYISLSSDVFFGCTNIVSIICLNIYPGDATKVFDENLDYTNCMLYVPCDKVDTYKKRAGWKRFNNIKCLGATYIDEPLDDVVITPSNTRVVVAWPVVDNAESYVIEIKTGGKTFCVVTFNNKGQLLSIEYTSASERMAEARDASAAYGYQYSIASLTPETQYSYTITALDASERTLSLKSGSFTTTREPVSVDEQDAEPEFKDKVYVQDKNIMVEGLSSDDYSIYNTAGKQVSNPVPAAGVYVVKVGDEAVKVMVK